MSTALDREPTKCMHCGSVTSPGSRARLFAARGGVHDVLVRVCSNQKCRQIEFTKLETSAASISEDDREIVSDPEPVGAIGKIKGTSPDELVSAIKDDLLTLDRTCDVDTAKVEDSARRLLDYLGYIAAKLAIAGKEEELTRIRKLISDVLVSGQVSTGKELTAHQRVAMRLEATCSAIGRMRSASEQRRRKAEELFNGAETGGLWASYAKAFALFAKYSADGSTYTHAAHGKLWAGPNPEHVMIEDLEQLNSLGWLPDYQSHCFYRLV